MKSDDFRIVASDPIVVLPAGQTAAKNGDIIDVGGTVSPGAEVVSVSLVDSSGAVVKTYPAGALNVDPAGSLAGQLVLDDALHDQRLSIEVVVDDSGAISTSSDSRSSSFIIDLQAPTSLSVTAVSATSVASVNLTLAAVGADDMWIEGDIEGGTDVRSWVPFATSAAVDLAEPDGSKVVVFRARDGAHNESQATAAVGFDRSMPGSAPTITSPWPLAKTRSNDVLSVGGSIDPDTSLVSSTLVAIDGGGDRLSGAGCMQPVAGLSVNDRALIGTVNVGTPCVGAVALALEVIVRNAAGTQSVSAASLSNALTIDNAPPGATSVAISNPQVANGDATGTADITLTLSGVEPDDGPVQVMLAGDLVPGTRVGTWLPLAGATLVEAVQLVAGDGNKVFTAQFRDSLQNTGLAIATNVELDTQPPGAASVQVDQGATVAQRAVDLTISGTEAQDMWIAGDVQPGADIDTWIPFSSGFSVVLSDVDGPKVVVVRLRDAVGNEVQVTTGVTLDRSLPISLPELISPWGVEKAKNDDTLSVAGSIGDSLTLTYAELVSFDAGGNELVAPACTTAVVGLTVDSGALSGSVDVGTACVGAHSLGLRVIAENAAGTTSDVDASVSNRILVDNLQPAPGTIAFADSNLETDATAQTYVVLILDAADTDGSTVEIHLSGDLVASPRIDSWVPISGPGVQEGVTLEPGDGPKFISAQFRDQVHNETSVDTIATQLDTDAPTAVEVSVDEGAIVATTQVSLTLAAVGASEMFLDGDVDDAAGIRQWISFANFANVELTDSDGAKVILFRARDDAGNETEDTTAVSLDRSIPISSPLLVSPFGVSKAKDNDMLSVSGSAEAGASVDQAEFISYDDTGAEMALAGCTTQVSGISLEPTGFSGNVNIGTACVGAAFVALRVVVTNAAGTRSTQIDSVSNWITIDNAAPEPGTATVAPADGAASGFARASMITLLMAAQEPDLSPVEVFIGGEIQDGPRVRSWVPFPGSQDVPGEEPLLLAALGGDGLRTITVQYRDQVHNLSVVRNATVTLDSTPPISAQAANLLLVESSPAPNDPSLIDDFNNSMTLTGLPGAVPSDHGVRVYGGSTLLAESTAGSDGSFAPLDLIYLGAESYEVIAVDPAGNVSENATVISLPQISGLAIDPDPAGMGLQVDAAPIEIVFSSDVPLSGVSVHVDGYAASLAASAGLTYTFEYTPVGSETEFPNFAVVRIRAPSGAGFASGTMGTVATTMTLDLSAPVIDLDLLSMGANAAGTADTVSGPAGTVSDNLSPPNVLTLRLIGQPGATAIATVNPNSDGSITSVNVGDNSFDTIELEFSDGVGNTTSHTLSNDRVPPTAEGLMVSPTSVRHGDLLTITVNVADNASDLLATPICTVGGRAASAVSGLLDTSDGQVHTFVYQLVADDALDAEGTAQVLLTAIDFPENTSSAAASVSFDYSPPVSTNTTPGTRTIWNASPGLFGTAQDASGIDSVQVSIEDVGAATWWDGSAFSAPGEVWLGATGDTVWTYDVSTIPFVIGSDYQIRWRATDIAGNLEAPGAGNTFTYDDSLPNAPTGLVATRNGEARIDLSWSAPGGPVPASYRVYFDEEADAPPPYVGSGAAEGDSPIVVVGTSISVTNLPPDRYTFAVTAVDGLGNESAWSNTASAASAWWTWYTDTPYNTVNDLVAVGSGVFIAVGDAGTIWRSDNGGLSWIAVPTYTTAKLNAAYVGTEGIAVVGNDGATLHSADGGLSFQLAPGGGTSSHAALAGWGSTLLATTSSGNIIRSTDGGQSWVSTSQNADQGREALWTDGSVWLAAGFNGALARSTNDGDSWTTASHEGVANDMDFAALWGEAGNYVAATRNGDIQHSTDGVSFSLVTSPTTTSISALYGIGSTVIGNGGNGGNGEVVRSTDGGKTWSLIGTGGAEKPADFYHDGTLLHGVGGTEVLVSDDLGATWSVTTMLSLTNSLNVIAGSDTFVVAGGWRGVFAASGNSGSSWVEHPLPTNGYVVDVWSNGTDVAVSLSDGSLWHSSDRGDTWSLQETIFGAGAKLAGAGVAVVAAANTVPLEPLRYSTNGGLTWQDATRTYRAQALWGDGTDFLVVGSGNPASSANGGASWTSHNPPGSNLLMSVWGTSSAWVAVGLSGYMVRTADKGFSWSSPSTGSTNTLGAVWGRGDVFLAAGGANEVYRSADAGATWSYIDLGLGTRFPKQFWGDDDKVILSTNTEKIFRSEDDGATWTEIAMPGYLNGFNHIDGSGDFIIMGGGNGWAVSQDAGLTWSEPTAFYPAGLGSANPLAVIDGARAVLGGPADSFVVLKPD